MQRPAVLSVLRPSRRKCSNIIYIGIAKISQREQQLLNLKRVGNVTSAGWQVTLCDLMRHVSSRSGVATLRTAIHLLLTYLLCDPIWHVSSRSGVTGLTANCYIRIVWYCCRLYCVGCEGLFQCASTPLCVVHSWRCDRQDDCGDLSDEENCSQSSVMRKKIVTYTLYIRGTCVLFKTQPMCVACVLYII